ncbi:MAG TPA: hypothetical protein VJL80_05305 [Aeromicrobium sp.]|nr:hypothetical protein [Aeromicrobium sp.]HKY57436.1 hypothetical protein [Aeromicrobium sp.]
MEPAASTALAPEDMPPPVVPATPVVSEAAPTAVGDGALEATGLMEPVQPETEPELDARELKALSRQERKEAKAALRREQQEARNAARQAKALAKAAAKMGGTAPAAAATDASATGVSAAVADEDVVEEVHTIVTPAVSDVPEADEAEAETSDQDAIEAPDEAAAATDPRSRAAQRVQRRLGKDAEKLSAAEARARAREEARRRRAQAKEQRSGVVAEEAVVRPPDEPAERNLAEDVSVVEPEVTEQTIEAEPVAEEPIVEQTVVQATVIEAVAEEPTDEEPAIEDAIEEPEPDLPEPVVAQRIDEPAPADAEEPEFAEEPEPVAEQRPAIEIREIHKPAVDGEPAAKDRSSMAPIAGVVGLVALGISVLLAVGALLVALGFDSGGLYEGLRTVANLLVGPLEGAFDFSGANAERKEHFLAWGAGSIVYLLISFVGQAVQRSNDDA